MAETEEEKRRKAREKELREIGQGFKDIFGQIKQGPKEPTQNLPNLMGELKSMGGLLTGADEQKERRDFAKEQGIELKPYGILPQSQTVDKVMADRARGEIAAQDQQKKDSLMQDNMDRFFAQADAIQEANAAKQDTPSSPAATSTQAQDAARNAAGTLKAGELFGSAAYGKPIVPPKFSPNTAQPADLSPDSVNDLSYSDFKTPFVDGKAPAAPPKSYVVQPEEAPTFDPTKLEGDRSPRAMALAQMGFNMNKLRLEREARTAGRKDFAAALDAAGYDPSTASSEDKAKFYAQGKELGLSSKQIDKYALDRAEKIAKQKDRIKNPDKYRQPSTTAAAAAAQVAGGGGGNMRRMPMELPPISQAGPYRPPQTQAGPTRPYQARNYYPPS